MRLQFSGSELFVDPVIIDFPRGDSTFRPEDYIAQGYTVYEVIVIGAGGGYGQTIKIEFLNPGFSRFYWPGGAGGGGGVHRIAGLLRDLATSIPVVVGRPGINQTVVRDFPEDPQVGGDGGFSSFGTLARASGGKGGLYAIWADLTRDVGTSRARGGAGGVGGSTVAGGGGAGGYYPDPNGANGFWNGVIGSGGGGAASGVLEVPADPIAKAFAQSPAGYGGAGAYNGSDLSVSNPARMPPTASGVAPTVINGEGGGGSGASAFPITGFVMNYGSGQSPNRLLYFGEDRAWGQVVIRMTRP